LYYNAVIFQEIFEHLGVVLKIELYLWEA